MGTPIDDFDLLIASAAKVRSLKLITDNIKHFERIEGIEAENWVER
jgi:tRNA(fMet)-specific endonuclease VapC